jgi:hypothetical protein
MGGCRLGIWRYKSRAGLIEYAHPTLIQIDRC